MSYKFFNWQGFFISNHIGLLTREFVYNYNLQIIGFFLQIFDENITKYSSSIAQLIVI